METTRLFVGNLNLDIEHKHLEDKFSHYGNVLNIDIKCKSDFDGNTVSKFAYVTIQSDDSLISKCVNTLHGCSWKGNILKVDVAKESFLERLRNEREQNLNEKKYPSQASVAAVADQPSSFSYKYEDQNDSFYCVPQSNQDINEEKNSGPSLDRVMHKSTNSEARKGFKRYDPTRPEHENLCSWQNNTAVGEIKLSQQHTEEKFVKVSDDLDFKGTYNGFSLLERFSGIVNKEEELSQPRQNDFLSHFHPPPSDYWNEQQDNHRPTKKNNFFMQANDDRLLDGVEWLLTPLTSENLDEFHRVRRELVDIYKLRHLRAVREKSKNRRRKFRAAPRESFSKVH